MSDAHAIYFKPAPGERIETTLILPEPESASFYAQLIRTDGSPVSGVFALLFSEGESAPVDQGISDSAGRLCFGPLTAGRLYTLQLHIPRPTARVLEIPLG